jgi:hypothetical protein
MSYKYLGYYDVVNEVVNGEEVTALVPEYEDLVDTDDYSNWYDFDQFMRSEYSLFDAIYGESNTSAIGLKMYREGFKLWRLT